MIISFNTVPGDGGFPLPFDCEITDIQVSVQNFDQAFGALTLNPQSTPALAAPNFDRNVFASWYAGWDDPTAAKSVQSERRFTNVNMSLRAGTRIYSLGSVNSAFSVCLSVDPS